MYDMKYNDESASSYNLTLKRKINIQSPARKYEEYDVNGRDGVYIENENTYDDIEIVVDFILIIKDGKMHDSFRKIKKWLLSSGTGKLVFTDDPEYFYLVKRVKIEEAKQLGDRGSVFSVNFICEPYQYLISGETEYGISDVLNNPYDECHPLYIVSGRYGTYKLIVNGNTVEVYVSTSDGKTSTPTYIDTEKMIAYTEDGIRNTYLKGDYESLYLQEGENTIETPKSTSGHAQGYTSTVKVIPRWRCK